MLRAQEDGEKRIQYNVLKNYYILRRLFTIFPTWVGAYRTRDRRLFGQERLVVALRYLHEGEREEKVG